MGDSGSVRGGAADEGSGSRVYGFSDPEAGRSWDQADPNILKGAEKSPDRRGLRMRGLQEAASPAGAGGPSGSRPWFVVPALFLGLLEGGLRAFGYGYPSHYFVKAGAGEELSGNGKFGWRFFSPAIARSPAVPISFAADKPAGTYRIFVLGESAAIGDPAPEFGFSRILEVMLREQHPELRFEVVNTAMAAINSHVILPIARDCARLHGDLFIVYMGNNEVIGPYGPGTVFDRFSRNLWLIRSSIWIRSTKIGQLLQSASWTLLRGSGGPEKWEALKMFVGNHVPADDPRLEKMYGHFRENLGDICEAARKSGASVILCTVATNLGDCAPFGSAHRSDLSRDARRPHGKRRTRQALRLRPRATARRRRQSIRRRPRSTTNSPTCTFVWAGVTGS